MTNDSNFVTSTELATKQDKLDSYSDSASVANDKLTINYKVKQEDGTYEVVDGFHRNRIGKEHEDIKDRVIYETETDKNYQLTNTKDKDLSNSGVIGIGIRKNEVD